LTISAVSARISLIRTDAVGIGWTFIFSTGGLLVSVAHEGREPTTPPAVPKVPS
jgi:hypothetical protein